MESKDEQIATPGEVSSPSSTSSTSRFSLKGLRGVAKRLRRKSSTHNDFNRKDPNDPYLYITNFEQVTDDECLAADKKNEAIYRDQLQTYNEVVSIMDKKGASFKKPDAPIHPPKPSNIEKLYEYRRKYVKTVALEQSEAVVYLLSIGKKFTLHKTGHDPHEFEAYEAIELAKEIQRNCPGDKMFSDRQLGQAWGERSEMVTQNLKRQGRVKSVYELEETTGYHDRVRSASLSAGNGQKGSQVYPSLPTVSHDSHILEHNPHPLPSAPSSANVSTSTQMES